tara:strand:- start:9511 stop:10128 length:618 start_codon:yes stop_codon:yes gene_type:complete
MEVKELSIYNEISKEDSRILSESLGFSVFNNAIKEFASFRVCFNYTPKVLVKNKKINLKFDITEEVSGFVQLHIKVFNHKNVKISLSLNKERKILEEIYELVSKILDKKAAESMFQEEMYVYKLRRGHLKIHSNVEKGSLNVFKEAYFFHLEKNGLKTSNKERAFSVLTSNRKILIESFLKPDEIIEFSKTEKDWEDLIELEYGV